MGDESNYVDSLRTGDGDDFWPRYLSAEPEEWMPKLSRSHGSSLRTFWLMHEPPSGTPLSQPGSAVAGNPEWLQAIESYSPWLTISGHDHRTPRRTGRWHCRVGSTVCVNAGQSDTGPLLYTLITAEFASERLALPRRMTVQVRPSGEKIKLPV